MVKDYKNRYKMVNYEKRIDSTLRSIEKDKRITQKNKQLILEFKDYYMDKQVELARISKVLDNIKAIALLFGKTDFDKADKEVNKKYPDISKVLKKMDKKEYSDWTKYDYKIMLRIFYRWLKYGVNKKKGYPPEVDWIEMETPRVKKIRGKDLLTHEDILKMIKVCSNPMHRSYISVLFNSGGRAREIGELTYGSVETDKDKRGAKIYVSGKTDENRVTRLTFAWPYLKEWMNKHPTQKDEDPLWMGIKNNGNFMSYTSFRNIVQRAGEKAGIKKNLSNNSFRKSWLTYASLYLSQSIMAEQYGHVHGSRALKHYLFPDKKRVDNEVRSRLPDGLPEGVKIRETKKDIEILTKPCFNCGETNPITNVVCSNTDCQMPLDYLKREAEERKRDKERERMLRIFVEVVGEEIPELKEAIKKAKIKL